MRAQVQLLTRIQGGTPAVMCLLAIASSLPVFLGHWLVFAQWLADPAFARVARQAAVAGLNDFLLAVVAVDVALGLWLYRRRASPAPLPRLSVLVVLVQVAGYVAMGIVYGPLTSPISTVTISALVVGLALLGRRPTLVGFVFALVTITLNDWLVLAGLVPYAPALQPATFAGGVPAPWWGLWQGVMFTIAMLFGVTLMLLLFARLDGQREALEALSRTDGLTGLSNRRYFMERLAIEQQRRDRYRQPFSIVVCDADHFKRVNDNHGHHAGDEVLVAIGRLLNNGLRIPGDVAARLGGEEFALLLTDCRLGEARMVCERLRRLLSTLEFGAPGRRFRVTLSMGVVECDAGNAEVALRAADVNLYQAKAQGRDRIVTSTQEAAP